MKTCSSFLLSLCVIGLLSTPLARLTAQEHTIKFATLATEGSTWMNVMREYDVAVRKESGGRVGFKMFPGGVQGEDKDVMRRIRLGQLHSAGITGVGIGEISGKLRILDAPFLFQNSAEVDYLHAVMEQEFKKEFEDNGFVLLGWAEVGFVYVFSKTPIRSVQDMKGVKMWTWEGDPIADATFKSLGVSPIPLSVVDVLTSLQTGLITAAYTAPLAALVLQWNTRVNYMTNIPLADAAGAVVISKKKFDTMPADLQEILVRNGRTFMAKLTTKSREENAAAIETIRRNGVQLVEVSGGKNLQEYQENGRRARQLLVGTLYDQAWLDKVERTLSDFRAGRGAPK